MEPKLDSKTVGRVLDILEVFEAMRKPITLSELAVHIDAPVSSCHGIIKALRNRGYVYSGYRGALYPTKRLYNLASIIAANDPIVEQIGPALRALRDETLETVILGKRQGTQIVYLEVLEGLHTIRYGATPGKLTPLHSSAIGKAVLGGFKPDDLDNFVRTSGLPRITDRTLTTKAQLIADIEQSHRRGYFITRGEHVVDVMGLARIIEAGSGALGIAIAGPLARMEENLARYVASLSATCDRIHASKDF